MGKVGITPAVLVRRILVDMEQFRHVEGLPLPQYLTDLENGAKDQNILGVYENNIGSRESAVVVTDHALWLLQPSGASEIRYEHMVFATWHPEEKRTADAVRVDRKDGSSVLIPIRGRHNGGADVFEFVRFVMRAIGTVGAGGPK